MSTTAANVVDALDATLRELQLAAQTKVAADGHDNTALTGGADGDKPPTEGARAAEMKADVNTQQPLSQQKVDGAAKSPVTGTAASVGTATEASSDNKDTKPKADDPGTENSQLSVKTAALFAMGDELIKGQGAPAPIADLQKNAAAVDQLLPKGVDPAKAAEIPDLPSDDEGLKKVASDQVAGYIQKCAEVYVDDVTKGAEFAAHFHRGLIELEKTAAAEGEVDPVAALVKVAEADAEAVAQLMQGMGGGDPSMGGMGAMPGMPEPDGDEGMAGAGDGDGDEGAVEGEEAEGEAGEEDEAAEADEGGEGMAAEGGGNAESILAALQQAGIDPAQLAKTAALKGLDETKVRNYLKTLVK